MNTAAHVCSAALMAWLTIAATCGHAAAPGEDPVVLSKPVDYLRLPTAKPAASAGLNAVADIPVDVKAKIARYEAKSMVGGGQGVATDSDVITTTTTSSTGMNRTCVQDIASNTNASAFNRYGPSTTKDQIVVLKGDLVNVCR